MKDEQILGLCPKCDKSVDIVIREDYVEVFGICAECGNIIFYSHKEYPFENTKDFLIPGD